MANKLALNNKILVHLPPLSCAILVSFVSLGSNFGTDMLFILLTELYLLFFLQYYDQQDDKSLLILAAISASASLLRWSGVLLIICGALLLTIIYRRRWLEWLVVNIKFGSFSSAPFLLWVVGRNYRLTHTFWGQRNLGEINPLENAAFSYQRISGWLFPSSITKRIDLVFLLAGIVILLVIFNRKNEWQVWLIATIKTRNIIFPVFAMVYAIFITFTTFTGDHIDSFDDRYQLILFIPLMIIFLIALDNLVLPHLGYYNKIPSAILIAFFGLWFAYQGFLIYRFIDASFQNGVDRYNVYNIADLHRSGFIGELEIFDFDNNLSIYSNNAAAVYFFTQQQVENSLYDTEHFIASDEYLLSPPRNWPDHSNGYLVWFTPNTKRNYFSPDQLSRIVNLRLLFKEGDGAIYQISNPNSQE